MLQPSQLEDVSVRYADEIAELREFFEAVGVPVGTPQAMLQVADWLHDHPGFHRDLTSQIWVMLHRRGSSVRYGETLGMLAVAAAGKQIAAQTDALVAHDLLRFVMEAHDRLNPPTRSEAVSEVRPIAAVIPMRPAPQLVEPPAVRSEPVVKPTPAVEPPPVAAVPKVTEHASMTSRMLVPTVVKRAPEAEDRLEAPARPVMDIPIQRPRVDGESADEHPRRGRGLIWFAMVAVLLVAVAAGWWMHRKSADDAKATPAPVVDGTNPASVEPPPAVVVAPEQPVVTAPAAKPSAIPENTHHGRVAESARAHAVTPPYSRPSSYKPELVPPYPQPSTVARSTPPPAASAPVATNARSGIAGSSPATAAPIVRSPAPAAKAGPTTVSSNVLSKQLDRPGLTREQEAEYDATGRRYPRLLRRTPAGTTQMASNTVPAMPGAANRPASSGTTAVGVVRTTSLGIMAGNVLYSPAAAYPQAASASHVSGAVKLEAVVDTAGNVVNARVISGPPQLRDAALSAVQQWRYKPYTPGGKARMFTTQALMEFELQ